MCAKMPEMKSLFVALARLVAATPHSCDVERLISAYDLVKSKLRSCLSPETIKSYLYVNINMPDQAELNVRPAVLTFLTDKDRRPGQELSSKTNEYFTGVFREATEKYSNVKK